MAENQPQTPKNKNVKPENNQFSSPYSDFHQKKALLIKLDGSLRTSYLISLAGAWGLTLEADLVEKLKKPNQGVENTPKNQLLQILANHLLSKGLSGTLIKAIFAVTNNTIYLLPAGTPELEGEKRALKATPQTAGIKTVRTKLTTDSAYRHYIHLSFATIKDDIARNSASKLNKETAGNYYDIVKYSIVEEDSMSDSENDSVDLHIASEPKHVMTNVITPTNTESQDSLNNSGVKIPKIEKFVMKNNVDAWLDNSCFILEMAGLRDQKKIISHLLGGLDQNLLLSVRQTLQAKDAQEELSTEDFRAALRLAAHQTDSDLVRQMQKLKYTEEMTNLKDLYLKISSLNRALFPKIKDDNTKTTMDTREFKEKVPKEVKNHSVFKASDKTGYELVALAQRLLDAGKNEVETNYFNSNRNRKFQNHSSGSFNYDRNKKNGNFDQRRNFGGNYRNRQNSSNYRNTNRNDEKNHRGNGHKRDNRDNAEKDFRRTVTCNFCRNNGHIEAECRIKQSMRQQYLSRDRNTKNKK